MGTSMNINSTTDLLATRRRGREAGRLERSRPSLLPSSLFHGDVLARGLRYVARDDFLGDCDPDALERCGRAVLVRCDVDADELEGYVELSDGSLALVDSGYGRVRVDVASAGNGAARAGAARLREALGKEAPDQQRVSVGFWMRDAYGAGEVRHRDIDAERWETIAGNYPGDVQAALAELLAIEAPACGRLILWRGDPGTGKSHALRALAREWSSWCSCHFVMDPDELLARGGVYMLDLLTWDEDDEDRWRLLILEDAGELIAADARAVSGQALSRLLNVADGLLGQGTRTMVIITTNEPVGRLHPAARRPGRCLADIEFRAFPEREANEWLAQRGHDARVARPAALAELFSLARGEGVVAAATPDPGFGFARALCGSH
jgi:hypothetical protein